MSTVIPTTTLERACARCDAEDCAGLCDTQPGELALAEELQREAELDAVFPLGPFFRRHEWAAVLLIAVIALIGAAIDTWSF